VIAHLTAFWHGDMDGPAFWLTLAGIGIPLIAVFLVALVKLADWSLTRWPGDLGSDEPAPPHDPHARFESLILALVLLGLPVIALTR